METLICVISMEFLPLSRRRSSARNVPGGEERGETDVFAGYVETIWETGLILQIVHISRKFLATPLESPLFM